MPKLDPERLIRSARELKDESKEICKRSRGIIEKSKCLEKIFTASRLVSDQTRRKDPLKRNATVRT